MWWLASLAFAGSFHEATQHALQYATEYTEINAESGLQVAPGILPLKTTAVDGLDTLMLSSTSAATPLPNVLPYTLGVTTVSVFETFIRVVGGFLAAYDMGAGQHYLDAAVSVADSLAPAWSAGPVPWPRVDLASKKGVGMPWFKHNCTTVADAGTIFFELEWLADRSGNSVYRKRADALVAALGSHTWVNVGDGNPCKPGTYEAGVGADSWFEMLIKTGRRPDLVAEFVQKNAWETMSAHTPGGHLLCIWPMYVRAPKLEAECVDMATTKCHLEPEAVEMMHTKKYNMSRAAQAFETCKLPYGYGNPFQASWVLAETIKYIYSPPWCNGVLSTQAHCRVNV